MKRTPTINTGLVLKPWGASPALKLAALVAVNSLMRDLGYMSDGRVIADSSNANPPTPYFFRKLLESITVKPLADYRVSAVYGQSFDGVLSNFASQITAPVQAMQAAAPDVSIAVIGSDFINGHMNQSRSARQIYDSAVTFTNQAVALSTATSTVKVFIPGPTDCDFGNLTAGWEQFMDEVEAVFTTNASQAPYRYVSLRQNPSIGVNGSAAKHLYHRQDGDWYHLNAAGTAEMAGEVAAAFAQVYSLSLPNELTSLTATVSGTTVALTTNTTRLIVEYQVDSGTWLRSPSAGTSFNDLAVGQHNFAARLAQKFANTLTATARVASSGGGGALAVLSETDATSSAPGTIVLQLIGSDAPSLYEWAYASGFAASSPWTTLSSSTFTVPSKDISPNGLVFRKKRVAGQADYDGAVYNQTQFHDPNAQIVFSIVSQSATTLRLRCRNSKLETTHFHLDDNYGQNPGAHLANITGPVGSYLEGDLDITGVAAGSHVVRAYDDGQQYIPPAIPFTV